MATFSDPSWTQLDELVASASTSLLICAPYITKAGLHRLESNLAPGVEVDVITRLSVEGWLAAVCDPEALLDFLRRVDADRFRVSSRLHAKAVVADGEQALVGSANVTWRAYSHNLELQAELVPVETQEVLGTIHAWDDSIRELDIADLESWVLRHRDAIANERSRQDQEPPAGHDELATAQEELDELSGGRAVESRPYRSVGGSLLEDFVDWLADHAELAGADEVVARHDNRTGANLTGHVKQSFFASYLFFQYEPEWIDPASTMLDGLAMDDIPQPEGALLEAWVDHVVSNAGLQTDLYSFPVLRGILPPVLGGTRQGGGGGSSTLKRVLPLVARWLQDPQ